MTYRIALVVKERGVMNSNKNEHKPLSDVRYNSTGCSEGLLLIGVWLVLEDLTATQESKTFFCIGCREEGNFILSLVIIILVL